MQYYQTLVYDILNLLGISDQCTYVIWMIVNNKSIGIINLDTNKIYTCR